jgi:hypothetical protein
VVLTALDRHFCLPQRHCRLILLKRLLGFGRCEVPVCERSSRKAWGLLMGNGSPVIRRERGVRQLRLDSALGSSREFLNEYG